MCRSFKKKFSVRTIVLLLFTVLFGVGNSLCLKAQSKPYLDSLKTVWEDSSVHDTLRLQAVSELIFRGYINSNSDSARILAEQMYKRALNSDSVYIGRAIELKGISYSVQTNYVKALEHYENALEIYKSIRHVDRIAGAYGNLGRTHARLGNITQAVDYYNKVLQITTRHGLNEYTATTLNNLGNIHLGMKDLDKAETYFLQCLEITKDLDNSYSEALAYNNLALIGAYKKDPEMVEKYGSKALVLFRAGGDSTGVMKVISRSALLYLETNQDEKALPYFQKVLDMSRELKNRNIESNALIEISTIYLHSGKLDLAEKRVLEALDIAKELDSPSDLVSCYNVLSDIYKLQGHYKKAFEARNMELVLRDSAMSDQDRQNLIHQEYRYAYLKKSIADSVQNMEKQKLKDALIAKKEAQNDAYRSRQIFLFFGIGILILFLGILFNRYRVIKKQKEIIEEQKLQVEEASKAKLEYERLKQEHLKADLTNAAQEITRRQQWLEQFKEKLYKVKSLKIKADELNDVFIDIANQMQLDAKNEEFYKNIDQVNHEFFHKLKEQFPDITPKEQELCGLIRLNLSTKEIASVRNVEPHSIRIARSRLRKRLSLDRDDDLYGFLQSLSS